MAKNPRQALSAVQIDTRHHITSDQKATGIVSPDLVPYAVPLLAFGAACRDVRLFHVATHRHCATVRFEQLC